MSQTMLRRPTHIAATSSPPLVIIITSLHQHKEQSRETGGRRCGQSAHSSPRLSLCQPSGMAGPYFLSVEEEEEEEKEDNKLRNTHRFTN